MSTSLHAIIKCLELTKVTLTRGGRALLAELSFSLAAGEALLVTGPNGAGKSTLLRAIAGFLAPSAGQIRLDGAEPGAPLAIHAHYLGHADALKTALTAKENLRFWAAMLGAPPDAPSAEAALARLALAHVADVPVAYLSAGQKRRVALARLLMVERPLWLLDEPLTALDQAAQERLAELMRDHLRHGGLIVAATHAAIGLPGARQLRLGQVV